MRQSSTVKLRPSPVTLTLTRGSFVLSLSVILTCCSAGSGTAGPGESPSANPRLVRQWPLDRDAAETLAGELMLETLSLYPPEWPVHLHAEIRPDGEVLRCDVEIRAAEPDDLLQTELRKALCAIVQELASQPRPKSEENSHLEISFAPRLAY
jgi:hypothetical protein